MAKKAKEETIKEYTIVNDNDGNDTFTVKAKNQNSAAHLALQELGWWVARIEPTDKKA